MPLYILPFDHRSTFVKGVFGFEYPLNKKQQSLVESYKQIVFDGFLQARNAYKGTSSLSDFMIFIDEEFGNSVIRSAKGRKVPYSLAVEKSGGQGFDFEYGSAYQKHLQRFKPGFAKALVRYQGGDGSIDGASKLRLREFIRFCRANSIATVVEIVLVPSDKMTSSDSLASFDRFARPRVTVKIIRGLTRAQVTPTVWKLESQASPAGWKKIIRTVNQIPIVVLGGGKSSEQIQARLKLAAPYKEIIGFAVGRTVFLDPLIEYRQKKISKNKAIAKIADSFLHLVRLWEIEKGRIKHKA